MPYIAPEVVQEVKRIDLLTYLKNYEPHELVHVSGNVYSTKTHDSLKISNGRWMWWSRGIGGKSVLDYLIKMKGLPFIEAAGMLAGKTSLQQPVPMPSPKRKEKKLLLPMPSRTHTQAVAYLQSRGIDLLSFATLQKMEGKGWRKAHLLSLAGVYQPAKEISHSKIPTALIRFLAKNPEVRRIVLHMDNDRAGRLAAEAIRAILFLFCIC